MDAGSAFLALALCMAADEVSTHMLLRAGGRETMIRRPSVRIAIKVPVGVLFMRKQKKSKAVAVGVPLVYCGAGVWNWEMTQEQMKLNRIGGR